MSRPLGCSALVVVAVVEDSDEQPRWESAAAPRSVWVIDQAAAELAREMWHDATEAAGAAGRDPDVDPAALVANAVRVTAQPN